MYESIERIRRWRDSGECRWREVVHYSHDLRLCAGAHHFSFIYNETAGSGCLYNNELYFSQAFPSMIQDSSQELYSSQYTQDDACNYYIQDYNTTTTGWFPLPYPSRDKKQLSCTYIMADRSQNRQLNSVYEILGVKIKSLDQ